MWVPAQLLRCLAPKTMSTGCIKSTSGFNSQLFLWPSMIIFILVQQFFKCSPLFYKCSLILLHVYLSICFHTQASTNKQLTGRQQRRHSSSVSTLLLEPSSCILSAPVLGIELAYNSRQSFQIITSVNFRGG